jgi:ABC-type antimicrobial peptide transport system permease subunit
MSIPAALRLALKALERNRLRSALTLLGMAIGVAVVIVMVALGTGARSAIGQHVKAAGVSMIHVTAGNYSQGDQDPSSGDVADLGPAGGAGTGAVPMAHAARPNRGGGWAGMGVSPRLPGRGAAATLSVEDVHALARDVPGIRYRAAGVSDTAVMSAGNTRLFGRLQGTDVEYPLMRALTMRAGRFFDDDDVADRARVLVLSSEAARKLFGPGIDPSGREVQVRGRRFTVVGVAARPAALVASTGLDEVFLPYTAVQDLLGIRHLESIAISVASAGEATRIARDVTHMLRTRHSLETTDPDDFTVRTQAREAVRGKGVNPLFARAVAGSVVNLDDITMAEMAVSLERSSRTMTALLASVASVSLLVGGVGIMNIMLVSVTERTREIGLRMAVGARGRDVMVQFLAEATTLSVVGGLAGILVGIGASGSVGRLLRWSTAVSPASAVIALTVAAALGVFFGYYPARQASRLDPISALRFE